MLQNCYVTERPSKKDGFCIKIYNISGNPIFSRQDLRGKPLNKPLGGLSSYCLLRLKSKEEGKDWINHLSKAIPDFEQMRAIAIKDNQSDSSDLDEVETYSTSDEPVSVPPVTLTQDNSPGGTLNPPIQISPRKDKSSKGPKKPPGKSVTPEAKQDSKINGLDPMKSPLMAQNITSRSGDLIGAKITLHNSGLSPAELKTILLTLSHNLKEDLNKVLESKLEEQANHLTTKIQATESHIAYALRLPTPLPVSHTSSASSPSKSPKQKFLFMLSSQFSLNTVLLFFIIYLLLSILWML